MSHITMRSLKAPEMTQKIFDVIQRKRMNPRVKIVSAVELEIIKMASFEFGILFFFGHAYMRNGEYVFAAQLSNSIIHEISERRLIEIFQRTVVRAVFTTCCGSVDMFQRIFPSVFFFVVFFVRVSLLSTDSIILGYNARVNGMEEVSIQIVPFFVECALENRDWERPLVDLLVEIEKNGHYFPNRTCMIEKHHHSVECRQNFCKPKCWV